MSSLEQFINDLKKITKDSFLIDINDIKTKNNYFLLGIQNSECFEKRTVTKLKRLYDTYANNNYSKNIILNNIKKLFKNNWDGAYAELTAYDLLNLALNNPCKIQINDISKKNTLAQFCKDSNVSDIDGYIEDALVFFEVKTLMPRFDDMIAKLKLELSNYDDDNCFIIQTDFAKNNIEICDDNKFALLKREIINAKLNKQIYISSKVVPGLNFRFQYKKGIHLESYVCESPYEQAERLERLPLLHYNQFVDGMFIKIFVCSSLNKNGSLICSKDFFRALARRVFCKLTKEEEIFDNNSLLTTEFIAKHLSGILFIVDLSACLEKDTDEIDKLYEVYLYSNPNAINSSKFVGYRNLACALNKLKFKFECDDFKYDNY